MQSSPGTTELRVRDVRATIDVARGGRIAQIDVGGRPLLWPALLRRRLGFLSDGTVGRPSRTGASGSREPATNSTSTTWMWTAAGTPSTGPCSPPRGPSTTSVRPRPVALPLQRDGWPFEGFARQTITVTESSVRCELSVESSDHPFPAAIGWHPWFLKPDRLTFTPRAIIGATEWACPAPNWSIRCLDLGRHLPQHRRRRAALRRAIGGLDGDRDVRLRSLGRVRPAGVRHVRGTPVGTTRCAHDAARTGHPRRPPAPLDEHLLDLTRFS